MRKIVFIVFATLFFLPSAMADVSLNNSSTKELKKMLSDVEEELYSRGYTTLSKQGRIEKAESNLKNIVNRSSLKNAVIGSVLTAAVTAHPAGLLIGGLAGSMVGKSKRYEDAEKIFAEVEHEIIVDEDDFLTEGEVRLAAFAGDITLKEEVKQEFEETDGAMMVDIPDMNTEEEIVEVHKQQSPNINSAATTSGQVAQFVASNVDGGSNHAQANTSAYKSANAQPVKPELESCYGRNVGDRKARQQLPHCFYMMY